MNLVFLNGAIVPADAARVSLFDRGFLYGDGVFETIRIQAGRPFCWIQHAARLEQGLELIRLQLPEPVEALGRHATKLIFANQCEEGVLRITISRGPGVRGYSPRGAGPPAVAMSLHPRPAPAAEGLRLIVSTLRLLAEDPLAGVKTANKLHQIVACAEAEAAGADDAILLNQRGEMAETTASNLFWIENDILHTPPGNAGLLPGVARGVLLDLAAGLGFRARESALGPVALESAGGVFVANVVSGPVEVASVDGRPSQRCARFAAVRAAFESMVQRDVGK